MPISGKFYSFTQENVNKAPAQHGVYQLYQNRATTYIGRAAGEGVTIRSRLQSHLRGDEGPCTKAAEFYKREITPYPVTREKVLIDEYVSAYGELPRCNDVRP